MTSLGTWLKDLFSRERRRAKRKITKSLVAYFWDGAEPVAHTVRDVSTAGFYLLTEQRWYRGTMIRMTFQEKGSSDKETGNSIEIMARVIRSGQDGVGFAFVLQHQDDFHPSKAVDMKALKRFLQNSGANHEDESVTRRKRPSSDHLGSVYDLPHGFRGLCG
jgi:PilZ domain